MLPKALTLALCFCPLCYVGCTMKSNVNVEIAKLPEVQQLLARGITLEWCPNGDLGEVVVGGLCIFVSSEAPAQEVMTK